MTYHELKIESRWFERVKAGEKTAEVRLHDRDYQTGDLLHLHEVNRYGNRAQNYVPKRRTAQGYFAPEWQDNPPLVVRITHVLPASMCDGLAEGYCLLSFEAVRDE